MIAGQETTSQLIDLAVFRAFDGAGGWTALAGRVAATAHVRRLLATESPVSTWRRVAAHDTVLAGRPLAQGTELVLELSGHHADGAPPTAYALAFGHGLHRCLGARLAELEAVTVLSETARALPDLRLVDPDPEWLRLLSFRAPLTVRVERTRERAAA